MFVPTSHEVESSLSSSESSQLCRRFTYSEIQLATQNLDESLVIGRGGFGKVYKGNITNGLNLLPAAIKRLDSTSNQGASEFWAEVNMLSKLRHCHLVSLVGYCNDGQEMILVYEYMLHGTLEDHLHKRHTSLSWVQRLTLCIGAARGLNYLHTGTGIKHGVVHRDVKSSNILLHDSWEAKISDFGLSKICPKNQQTTYINTGVKGTFGYLDPDYFYTVVLTRKSDVYAFGVVLFEVLCGRRAVDTSIDEEQWALAIWVQDSIKDGKLKQIVDTKIRGLISPKCLKDFAQLANRCLHRHPKQRPTMAEVVAGLESILTLQGKGNNTLQPTNMQVFAKKALTVMFPSNDDNSGKVTKWTSARYECLMNEASLLVKLEHENLAKLIGYCIERATSSKLFLVYDCRLHATFDRLMFDPICSLLNWDKRYRIILGVARALLYLHRDAPIPIIHGDVKPGNILLDGNLKPTLSGFLNTRYLDINVTEYFLSTSFALRRYMAPEYMCYANVSTKVDVYSLGVLILETITGHRMPNGVFPLEYVERNRLDGTISSIIDPRLDADSSVMTRFLEIGLLCVHHDAEDRPTMEEVVSMLLDCSSLTITVAKMQEMITRECSNSTSTPADNYYYDTAAAEDLTSELFPR